MFYSVTYLNAKSHFFALDGFFKSWKNIFFSSYDAKNTWIWFFICLICFFYFWLGVPASHQWKSFEGLLSIWNLNWYFEGSSNHFLLSSSLYRLFGGLWARKIHLYRWCDCLKCNHIPLQTQKTDLISDTFNEQNFEVMETTNFGFIASLLFVFVPTIFLIGLFISTKDGEKSSFFSDSGKGKIGPTL